MEQLTEARRPAGSYARQSLQDAEGIDAQHMANSEFGTKAGLVVPAGRNFHFSDNHVSGKRIERPDFDRLKAVVAAGAPFQFLIVRNPDRFGRWQGNVKQFIAQTHWFEQHGVRVLFADDPTPNPAALSDDGDDVHAIREFMKAWMAGQEIKLFQERSRHRCRKLTLEGYWVSGQCPYATERWLVNGSPTAYVRACERDMPSHVKGYHTVLRWATDGTKEIVCQLFDGVLAGYSVGGLARLLNERAVPAPHQKAWSKRYKHSIRFWSRSTVYTIINNPVYCGTLVYGVGHGVNSTRSRRRLMFGLETASSAISEKGALLVRNAIPDPPVDEATWFAVQREISGESSHPRPRRRASSSSMLSGHVRCAYCHRCLWVQTKSRWATTPRYLLHYHTQSNGLPKCPGSGRGLHIADVDALVGDAVGDLLNRSSELADAVLARVRALLHHRLNDAVTDTSGPAHLELQRLQAKCQRLWHQMAQFDPDSFAHEQATEVVRSLEGDAQALKARLAHHEALARRWHAAAAALEGLLTQRGAVGTFFRNASPAERRRILLAVTEPIIVDLRTGQIEMRIRPFNSTSS